MEFKLPNDASAWWAFVSSSAAGLLLTYSTASPRVLEAILLVGALSCLFLASDWISALSGRGAQGKIPKRSLASLPGLALSLSALSCLALFFSLQPESGLRFWILALASGLALTLLMFLLRMEMLPMDMRLILLSSLLCTLPALFLGFLSMGESGGRAWLFWLAPALYFPASALFAWSWLKGLYQARRHLALLALPLLALIVAALSSSAWIPALFISAYLAYMLRRMLKRYEAGPDRMPSFSEILEFSHEQAAWNSILVIAWIWQVAWP